MSEEELIETLKEFEKNRVEKLKEPSRNLFYAIMKIADERDKYKEVIDKALYWLSENTHYIDFSVEKLVLDENVNLKELLELLEEIE